MRSSSGPWGLSSQRFFASEISSACAKNTSNSALKSMGAITPSKAEQRCGDAFADRQHLEQLAHFRRRKKLLRLRRDRRVDQRILDVGLAEHVGNAAVHQE